MDKGRQPFQMSIESRSLIDYLATISHHDLIPYADLNRKAGTNVQENRGCLNTACRNMIRDGKVFEPVRGQGMRLLTDDEKPLLAQSETARIRRKSKRTAAKLLTAKRETLKSPHAFDCALTVLSLFDRLTRPAMYKKIEGAVTQAQARLNPAETLRLFGVNGDDSEK